MIVTEKEARTKWCPQARTYVYPPDAMDGTTVGGVNRGATVNCNCVASHCAAWRWVVTPRDAEMNGEPRDTSTGYCGLAYSVRLP